jgi:predicted Zn-dependent protease with MMP-like domain
MAGMADDGSARVSSEEFDDLVSAALDDIPPELARAMDNVAVFVEDEPPEDGLLGLYEGVPLTERDSAYAGVLPDRITIYRRPIRAIAADAAEIVQQVRITVVHELAHHFGIDDDRLDELGWG